MKLDKVIYSDVDGVVFDYNTPMIKLLNDLGHTVLEDSDTYQISTLCGISEAESDKIVFDFSISKAFQNLPPLPNVVEVFKRLHYDKGYRFVFITACGTDPRATFNRYQNFLRVFGEDFVKNAIEEIICVNSAADKSVHLLEYRDGSMGQLWVEDHITGAMIGSQFGYTTALYKQVWNKNYAHHFDVVENWTELEEMVEEIEKQ